jgi:predicted lipid carrier protein YhbT
LKGIYHFQPENIFAVSSRKVLKADMWDCFEFRCSYKLTNMSLKQFTSKMQVKHQKLSGDEFDYSVKRYPWTPLSDEELQYCINDVLGLVEAINALMERDNDTLQTIPLTSTGYVRRNAKRAMKDGSVHHNFVYSILPDIETYIALREAFRGGNTHANRYYAGDIVENVHSADRSSSYPAVMCNCEFPMSVFTPILPKDLNTDYIARCITIRHKALLLRIGIENLSLRDKFWGCPYLSKDKCRNIRKAVDTEDNGRILEAEYLETTITDIDLKIITEEYQGKIIFLQGWYASYKKLPEPLINEVIKYYRDKTELKGVIGQEIYYDKAKALLNSLY